MKIILLTILLSIVNYTFSCSMFKITENGKTIVGNNEDYFKPSTKIWFENNKSHKFGVAYLGFDNDFSQGALNSQGLVFDGFAMDYLAVNDTAGKNTIPNTEYLPYIMRNFANVREVKAYFKTLNLSHMTNSMYLFVDKSGEYLIVEGDSLILGNDAIFTLSNFYPSQVSNQENVQIPFFQNGLKYINDNNLKADFSSCSSVMSNLHQNFTQYSSIYDLSTGIIKVHHFHNYEEAVEFNLEEELAKENHQLIIPELFSKESEGYKYYYDYNFDAIAMVNRIEAEWELAKKNFDEQTLQMIATEVETMVNSLGYDWLRSDKLDGAIYIFKFNISSFPNSSNAFDSMGEAYMVNKQYDLSIENYKKAIKLNKKNQASKDMLKQVKKLKKES